LIDAVRPQRVAERQGAEERRAERATLRRECRARRQVGVPEAEPAGPAAAMGRKVSGEAVLPVHRGWVSVPLERLARHMLVLGASGSGKTETLLRLVWAVARSSDWRIFFLDAKGDEATPGRS
jgi:predicted NACHT family NTPase